MIMPTNKEIVPPQGGWKARTYYVVEVSRNPHNPLWVAIFYSGFLEPDGTPGAYAQFWAYGAEDVFKYREAYYLRAVSEIDTSGVRQGVW